MTHDVRGLPPGRAVRQSRSSASSSSGGWAQNGCERRAGAGSPGSAMVCWRRRRRGRCCASAHKARRRSRPSLRALTHAAWSTRPRCPGRNFCSLSVAAVCISTTSHGLKAIRGGCAAKSPGSGHCRARRWRTTEVILTSLPHSCGVCRVRSEMALTACQPTPQITTPWAQQSVRTGRKRALPSACRLCGARMRKSVCYQLPACS